MPLAAVECAEGLARLANLSYVSKATSLKMIDASSTELYSIGNFRACAALEPAAVHCVFVTAVDWQGACVPSACDALSLHHALKLHNATSVRCGDHSYGALSYGFWFAIFALLG